MNPDDILTLTQAAEQYADRVNRRQIERACARKQLATVAPPKPSKRRQKQHNAGKPPTYRVRRSVLEAWLNKREAPPDHVRIGIAAEACKVNTRLLYEAVKSGAVPSTILERRYGLDARIYVRIADVEAWRDEQGVRSYRTHA